MIAFRPYSAPISHPYFGQNSQPSGVQAIVSIDGLSTEQRALLEEFEESKKNDPPMIAKVEQSDRYKGLVRVTLAIGQRVKEFVQLMEANGILVVPENDHTFHILQHRQPCGVQVLVRIQRLSEGQKEKLRELEQPKKGEPPMIAKVERLDSHKDLVRVTLAIGQRVKEFVQLMGDNGIVAVPEHESTFRILESGLRPAPGDYAFATMFPSPKGSET